MSRSNFTVKSNPETPYRNGILGNVHCSGFIVLCTAAHWSHLYTRSDWLIYGAYTYSKIFLSCLLSLALELENYLKICAS